jgi:stage V sporulation protein SpoVS
MFNPQNVELNLPDTDTFTQSDLVRFQVTIKPAIEQAVVMSMVNQAHLEAAIARGWVSGMSIADLPTAPPWLIRKYGEMVRAFIMLVQEEPPDLGES